MAAKGDHQVDENRVPATHSHRQGKPEECLKDHRAEPARPVMARRGIHSPVRGVDSTGGGPAPAKVRDDGWDWNGKYDEDSMDVDRLVHRSDRPSRVPTPRRA
eukprot:3082815-Amphidinium_carterae.1